MSKPQDRDGIPVNAPDEGLDESEVLTDDDVVELIDDEGNSRSFVQLALVEVDGIDYAMLAPVEQVEDEESDSLEVFLFQYEELDDGEVAFTEIEDEATYEKVQEYCATILDMEIGEDEE